MSLFYSLKYTTQVYFIILVSVKIIERIRRDDENDDHDEDDMIKGKLCRYYNTIQRLIFCQEAPFLLLYIVNESTALYMNTTSKFVGNSDCREIVLNCRTQAMHVIGSPFVFRSVN